ncbi:MAG: hypothetical protein R8K48_00610 [Gallionella sp.]
MHRRRNLALGLNAGVPLASNTGHGDILDCANDRAAWAVVIQPSLGNLMRLLPASSSQP